MRRVIFMAFLRLPSARTLWAAPTGRALAFVGARSGAFRHASTQPPALTLRATHEAAEASAAAAVGGAAETALEMKARLGVGKAKNVGRGPSPYTLGVGAKSGLPRGCPSAQPPWFTVLGIETSCDDTGAAVVRSDGCVLGEALASQHEIHAKFGGVVPGLARDAHEQNIDAVIGTALAQAGLRPDQLDAVAVTVGPGLEICLRVGATAARALAAAHQKPFVEVHHLEAHCLLARPKLFYPPAAHDEAAASVAATAFADADARGACNAVATPATAKTTVAGTAAAATAVCLQVEFPFAALLVSGGHCQTLLVQGVGHYAVLGGTLDDALGEAYDKAARMLGILASPGGPALEQLALQGDPASAYAAALPIPLQRKPGCDFSYAGLKNAFRLQVQKAITAHEDEERVAAGPGPTAAGDEATTSTTTTDGGGPSAPLHAATSSSGSVYVASSKQRNVEELGAQLPLQVRADLAAAFQKVAVRHLTDRLARALDSIDARVANQANQSSTGERESAAVPAVQTLAVVGGVAANQAVRAALAELCASRTPPLTLVAPPPRLCTDNGVMVAWAGVEKLLLGISDPVELPAVAERPVVAVAAREPSESSPGAPAEAESSSVASNAATMPRAEKRRGRAQDVRPRWPLGSELGPLV